MAPSRLRCMFGARVLTSASRVIRGADWAVPLRQAIARSPADTVAWVTQHTRLLKSDDYSRVGLLDVQRQLSFVKLYLAKSPMQRLGFRLGFGRGIRSFDAARELASLGLSVPAPRTCLLVPEGILLLTEGIADSQDLRALWLGQPTADQAAQYMRCAGEALAALHCAGFAHGDCKWSNLLWNGELFYLVDLEAVRKVGFTAQSSLPPHPRQLRDLARFTIDAQGSGASQEQYDIFLRSYSAGTNCPRGPLASAIGSAAQPIRRRHAKKYGKASRRLQ